MSDKTTEPFKFELRSGPHPRTEDGRRRFWALSELLAARGIFHRIVGDEFGETKDTRLVLVFEDYATLCAESRATVIACVVDSAEDMKDVAPSYSAVTFAAPETIAEMLDGYRLITSVALTYAAGLPISWDKVKEVDRVLLGAHLNRLMTGKP